MDVNKSSGVFVIHSDPLDFKAIDTPKGMEYFASGYISTSDLDLVNDIVTKGCMDDMFQQFDDRVIKLDFEHETFRGKSEEDAQFNKTRIPLGKSVSRERDQKGLKVTWKFNDTWKKFDEKGNVVMTFKDIWKNVEEKYYDAFSIAYLPKSTAMKNVKGTDIRLLDRVNLLNVALTGNPINPGASMTSVMAKSLEYIKEIEKTKGETMTKEKIKDNPEGQDPKEPVDKEAPKEGAEKKPEGEQKANELVEVKARLDSLEKKLKSKDDELKELKAVVEKARPIAHGPEDKSQIPGVGTEGKAITGMLDLL